MTGSGNPIVYAAGCASVACAFDPLLIAEAVAAVKHSDQVVLLLGLDQHIEKEGRDGLDTLLHGVRFSMNPAIQPWMDSAMDEIRRCLNKLLFLLGLTKLTKNTLLPRQTAS